MCLSVWVGIDRRHPVGGGAAMTTQGSRLRHPRVVGEQLLPLALPTRRDTQGGSIDWNGCLAADRQAGGAATASKPRAARRRKQASPPNAPILQKKPVASIMGVSSKSKEEG